MTKPYEEYTEDELLSSIMISFDVSRDTVEHWITQSMRNEGISRDLAISNKVPNRPPYREEIEEYKKKCEKMSKCISDRF